MKSATLLALVSMLFFSPLAWAETQPPFLLEWGTLGAGDDQYYYPRGVKLSDAGHLYVVEQNNHRVHVSTTDGTFINKWGANGTGDGQFHHPVGIAIDSGGNVYVMDAGNHRIQKFTSTGTYVTKWGTLGSGDGQFTSPMGVAIDASDNIYVMDTSNHRVQKFTSAGTFIAKWGSEGSGDGEFKHPVAAVFDAGGELYVVDTNNARIQVFTDTGTFLRKWGSFGSGDGQLFSPSDVAVDDNGYVYVSELNNHRIQVFTSTGAYVTKWGTIGSGAGQFNTPCGVTLDDSGDIYVSDAVNNRMQKFGPLPAEMALGMEGANLQSDCLSAAENEFTVCVTVTDVTPDPTDVQGMKLNFSFDDAELDLLSIDVPGGSIWGAGSNYVAFTTIGTGTGELNISSLLFGGISAGTGGTVCCLTFERKAVGVLDYEISAADIRDPLNDTIVADLSDPGGSATRILGDFTTTLAGGATDCGLPGFGPPDGDVDVYDLGVFSNHFGAVDPAAEYCCIVDVGPTTTSYIFGEPLIDGEIDFEDLVIFSISFGFSTIGGYTAPAPAIIPDAPSQVRLVPVAGGSGYVVAVELSPATGVQALHAVLDYDPAVLRYVGAKTAGEGSFLGVIPGQRIDLNLAALGVANAWTQTGSVARLSFERIGEGSAEVSFHSLDLRSSFNDRLPAQGDGVTLGGPVATSPTALNFLAPASPNPFAGTTTFGFTLATASKYNLAIYNVAGREIRRFTGNAGPGEFSVEWDGSDDSGRRVSSGLYYYRLSAGNFMATKRVVLSN